jgi:anti-anti-sigma regulatory factor
MEHYDKDVPGNRVALRLEPSLRIGDVEASRHALLGQFDGHAPIKIDISAIQSVDTAGVQLLLAVRQEADRRGIRLEYCGDSPELFGALKVLGLLETVLGRRP